MKIPKVSVIMAVYNSEKFLDEAIESVLNQEIKDFEFIITNDCSTDGSLKIIKNYMKKDKRIILVNNSNNKGAAISRNNGLKIAKGEYVAIMDSDDVCLAKRFQKQTEYLEKNKDIYLIASGAIIINEKNEIVKTVRGIRNEKKLKERLHKKMALFNPSVMFRNERVLNYRTKLTPVEDYDYFLRILKRGDRIICMEEPLIKYRIRTDSISFVNQANTRLLAEKVKEINTSNHKNLYSKFNKKEFLNYNLKTTRNKIILQSMIRNNFVFGDYQKARYFCKRYFKYYGVFNKNMLYYFATFSRKGLNNFFIKIVPTNILRRMNE